MAPNDSTHTEDHSKNHGEDSLRTRYFFKLGANLFSLPLTLLIQALSARLLGPVQYGSFAYLTTFHTNLLALFDAGTSTCFYSKLSRHTADKSLVIFNWMLVAVITLLGASVVGLTIAFGFEAFLWPGHSTFVLWLAFFWAVLTLISQSIQRMVDALALTKSGELWKLSQRLFACMLLGMLFLYLDKISLPLYFSFQFIILGILCLGWGAILSKSGFPAMPLIRIDARRMREYVREFYSYCSPLLVYSIIGLFSSQFDRWLLETQYGAAQQGYYSLAFQISAACFLFSSAMTPLFTREFSRAVGRSDMAQMRALFLRHIPTLYCVTSFLGVFVAFQSKTLVALVGGSEYLAAAAPLAVFAFYPIHQTYGQLSGAVYYATGQTRVLRNIGVLTMLLGVPVSLLLLLPQAYFGLTMGATGLGIKMVLIQIVAVNLQLWFNCNLLNLKFGKLLCDQIVTVCLFAFAAFACTTLGNYLTLAAWGGFCLGGILYLICGALIILLFPQLTGVNLTRGQRVKA